eukprot:14710006-Alexandrium_andersonii.AAC.1
MKLCSALPLGVSRSARRPSRPRHNALTASTRVAAHAPRQSLRGTSRLLGKDRPARVARLRGSDNRHKPAQVYADYLKSHRWSKDRIVKGGVGIDAGITSCISSPGIASPAVDPLAAEISVAEITETIRRVR